MSGGGSARAFALIGGGRMGQAMLTGWLTSPDTGAVVVVEPHLAAPAALATDARVTWVASADAIPASFSPDVVVLAVKPQMMADALPAYRHWATADRVFLSIAAGWTLASFTKHLGADARIIRSMPNTPAAIGRGVTVAVPGPGVTAQQRAACDAALRAVGLVEWVEDEALMDAITALSGSGPAYVFHLVEAMAAAGVAAGLPIDLAMTLARATVSGAGALLDAAPDDDAARLRQNVTSPGGTTAAALSVLMADPGLTALMTSAIAAAARRSRELAT